MPIYGAGAVCLDNKVYVIGGHNDKVDAVDILDLATYKWSPGPRMLNQLHFPKAAAIGHNIYVLHDNDNVDYMLPLQCLDTRTNEWHERAHLPAEITHTSESSMVAMGDALYVQADGWHKYNTRSDSWTILSQPPGIDGYIKWSFVSASPVVMGDKIVVCGGSKPMWTPIYDCSQDSWTMHKSPGKMSDFNMAFNVAL